VPTDSLSAREVGRVLIVGPTPPPYGGMAIQSQALVARLSQDGVDVRLLATNPKVVRWIARIKGVRTLVQSAIFLFDLVRGLIRSQVVHLLGASHWYFVLRVLPTIICAKLFGRRIILNYRGGEAPVFFARFPWLVLPALQLVDAITVPSAYLQSLFLGLGYQARVIPNFVDLARFQFRQRDCLKPNLLLTRSLEPLYNIPMALRAFVAIQRLYPEARLDVVGTGSEEASLKRMVQQQGCAGVYFHGAVRNEEIPRFLDSADVLLNPTNADNMPINLMEAFAAGVPVVTTNVGGIPDLVGKEGAALMVEADDAPAMARCVDELLRQPNLVSALTQQARKICEQMSWEQVGRQWVEMYRSIKNTNLDTRRSIDLPTSR
jgi:phenylacetate-CoA ligase